MGVSKDLGRVTVEKLKSDAGLRQLFELALRAGYVTRSEHDWDNFVALAEQCLYQSTVKDRGAMFASNVRARRYLFSAAYMDRGRARTRRIHGEARKPDNTNPLDEVYDEE